MPTIPHPNFVCVNILLITKLNKSMKKNTCVNGNAMLSHRWKIFLIMKLLTVLILGSLIQSYAVVSQAQTKRLNLSFENA